MANSNNSNDPVYSYIKAIVLLIVYLASLYEAKAQVHLVKDVNTQPQSSTTGSSVTQIGNIAYFTAYNNQNGIELWKTDGTANGTVIVKDINPGPADSEPQRIINVNDILYFVADDGVHGNEIWRSDGTEEGTYLVFESEEGRSASTVLQMAGTKDYLYFVLLENNTTTLWRTNGTETGMVTDVGSIRNLTAAGNAIYFTSDGSGENELWRSEGTDETTYVVSDISGSNVNTSPDNLTYVKGTLYFTGYTPANGFELWKTDGTADGTTLVLDIVPGAANSAPNRLVPCGNKLYFMAAASNNVRDLWVTDGTNTSVVIATSAGSGITGIGTMKDINGSLFFGAFSSIGMELWKTDGTLEGTVLLEDIAPGAAGSNPDGLTLVNGIVYFSADDGVHGWELWKTDGNDNGTSLVKDIADGDGSYPHGLFTLGNNLYFWADDRVHGSELWTTNASGTTKLLKDIANGNSFSGISSLIANDDYAWFGDVETGVWRTDGSEAGTFNIRAPYDVQYKHFLKTSDKLYFVEHDNSDGAEGILVSDGIGEAVPLHTAAFKSINWIFELNGVLYFAGDMNGSGMELWKSNGDFDDITMVADIRSGIEGSHPYAPFVYNGALYFRANDGVHGAELWMCEGGTAIGTKMVKDINPGPANSNPQEFAISDGRIFFNATTDEFGQEVWISDGTEEGTHMVADIYAGPDSGYPLGFTSLNNNVYFFVQDGVHGFELWRTDGTEEGTRMVKDIHPSADNYDEFPDWLTVANGGLYFSASDGEHGLELWKSDGTEAGTSMLKDITPGPGGSSLYWFSEIDGRLFFVANGTMWRSNGTGCSTLPLIDDTSVSYYESFAPTVSGDKVYFVGISGENGAELYYYDFSNIDSPGCTQTIVFEEVTVKTIGDAAFELRATSSAGLPVTFSVSGDDVISIDGNKVTIKGAGQAIVSAIQAGDLNYASATVQQTIVINKKQQAITFGILEEKIAGQLPFTLTATASSGLPVIFESSDADVVTISGNTVTINGPGEVSITARQTGNAEYDETSISQPLVVKVITALEEDTDKLVSVYPNPATDFVIVDGSALRDGSLVNLMDMNGRIIRSAENETTLDVRSLPTGIYIVRVTTKDVVVTKRIIKK